jgi:hypothetical protein
MSQPFFTENKIRIKINFLQERFLNKKSILKCEAALKFKGPLKYLKFLKIQ